MPKPVKLAELPTYIYIDGSNIRSACRGSLGMQIDFKKLYDYFEHKYPSLQAVEYFEGIAVGDEKKQKVFELYKSYGYIVKALERKTYEDKPIIKYFDCKKCGVRNRVEAMPKSVKMKSNVDVFLCSEMMREAIGAKNQRHLILVSCDGDYAEMVNNLLAISKDIQVSVLATPYISKKRQPKRRNYLSDRLMKLVGTENYHLLNIEQIKDMVS